MPGHREKRVEMDRRRRFRAADGQRPGRPLLHGWGYALGGPKPYSVRDSRRAHRGGGKPHHCGQKEDRYIAFAAIAEIGKPFPDYEATVPVPIQPRSEIGV